MSPTNVEPSPTAKQVAERLAVYLGPHTARVAVKTFSVRALARGPETIRPSDAPQLLAALLPMLRAFIGRENSEALVENLRREIVS
jgi:hypothetical protein